MRTHRIAVIVAAYNHGHLLPALLTSLQDQTLQDFDVVVVDDASSDQTREVVGSWPDPRVHYVRRDTNGGPSAARNSGVRETDADVVVFLDADDRLLDHALATYASAFSAQQCGVVSGAALLWHPGPPRVEKTMVPSVRGPGGHALFLSGAFAVRRNIFELVGGYNEDLRFAENTELGLRIKRFCSESGYTFRSVAETLVAVDRSWSGSANAHRRQAALLIADQYEQDLRECGTWGRWITIAAVESIRLGDFRTARHLFRVAAGAQRWSPKSAARVLASHMPAVATRVWRRRDQSTVLLQL